MKFTYTGNGLNNYYGINASNGDVLEIEDPAIIRKMKNHPEFKSVVKKTAKKRKSK